MGLLDIFIGNTPVSAWQNLGRGEDFQGHRLTFGRFVSQSVPAQNGNSYICCHADQKIHVYCPDGAAQDISLPEGFLH